MVFGISCACNASGHMRLPRLEVTGISAFLSLAAGRDTLVHPADVLWLGRRTSRLAWGRGLGEWRCICPHAFSNLSDAAGEALGAADVYARSRCARGDVARHCREAEVVFQPLMFEGLGGVSSEAVSVVTGLIKAVALRLETSMRMSHSFSGTISGWIC